MEAYREVISGKKLVEFIALQEELKESELEVIIQPVWKKEKRIVKSQSINIQDLSRHNMGRVLSLLDRESMYSYEN